MHVSTCFATWTLHVSGVADRLAGVERSASPEVRERPMAVDPARIPLINPGPVGRLVLLLALYRTPTDDHRSTDLVRHLTVSGPPLIVQLATVDLASDAAVRRSGRGPR